MAPPAQDRRAAPLQAQLNRDKPARCLSGLLRARAPAAGLPAEQLRLRSVRLLDRSQTDGRRTVRARARPGICGDCRRMAPTPG